MPMITGIIVEMNQPYDCTVRMTPQTLQPMLDMFQLKAEEGQVLMDYDGTTIGRIASMTAKKGDMIVVEVATWQRLTGRWNQIALNGFGPPPPFLVPIAPGEPLVFISRVPAASREEFKFQARWNIGRQESDYLRTVRSYADDIEQAVRKLIRDSEAPDHFEVNWRLAPFLPGKTEFDIWVQQIPWPAELQFKACLDKEWDWLTAIGKTESLAAENLRSACGNIRMAAGFKPVQYEPVQTSTQVRRQRFIESVNSMPGLNEFLDLTNQAALLGHPQMVTIKKNTNSSIRVKRSVEI